MCVCVCVCVCETEYYATVKRNEVRSFVELWIDLESVIQNKVSQKEKQKYINAYMWNLENGAPISRAGIEMQM